jgi:hypothetical protein
VQKEGPADASTIMVAKLRSRDAVLERHLLLEIERGRSIPAGAS